MTQRSNILAAMAMALSVSAASMNAAADVCSQPAAALGDQLIVAGGAGATGAQLASLLESLTPGLDLEPIDQFPGRPIHLMQAAWPQGWSLAEVEAWIDSTLAAGLPQLSWMELDYLGQVPGGGTGSIFVDGLTDDQVVALQYARDRIALPQAMARSDGGGTVVAIMDTGLDLQHPAFAGSIVPGGFDFVTGTADVTDRNDGSDSDGDGVANELVGHGTFVASMVRFVAPGARILPVRVLDGDGNGRLWTLARGIVHAVDRGVEVINISVVSDYDSAAVEAAIDEATSLGIVVVASAGNCNGTDRLFPASKSNVLGVAATDRLDRKAGFSNYGDDIDLAAPGASPLVGVPDPATSILGALPGGRWGAGSGTSFAAPIVAGVAALVRAQHPEWLATEATSVAIEQAILLSCDDVSASDPAFGGQLGAGRIDAGAAVLAGPVRPAEGDLNGDGSINGADLGILLTQWGAVHSSADLNGDGVVDGADLGRLLTRWT